MNDARQERTGSTNLVLRSTRTATAKAEPIFIDTDIPHTNLPPHYELAPTIPSPFKGSLDASLDAILIFASKYPELQSLTSTLLADVDHQTHWTELFQSVLVQDGEKLLEGRDLLVEFLFLITRSLLPEQIVENRAYMLDMYLMKRSMAGRVTLRYDMLREWKKASTKEYMVVDFKAPSDPPEAPVPPMYNPTFPNRRPLMPNIFATIIAASWTDHRDRRLARCMRHHVTDLDQFLLLSDEEVERWGTTMLLLKLGAAVLHWQWIRKNNEVFHDMKVNSYEELSGLAEECEWIRNPKEKGDEV